MQKRIKLMNKLHQNRHSLRSTPINHDELCAVAYIRLQAIQEQPHPVQTVLWSARVDDNYQVC